MAHDYKADRERLEAEFDRRHPELADLKPCTLTDRFFECFKTSDPDKQLEAILKLQNEMAAMAVGVL